jgi:hypothetical protein
MSSIFSSTDIEGVLDKIRQNSQLLANYHRKRYLTIKSRLKYYKIPIILLSSLNSVASVSLQNFMNQTYISLINMFMSLIVGVIGSIEMFYQYNKQLEIELAGSREFYILSCDIYKWLSLEPSNRVSSPKEFLNESYNRYIKLIETSITLKKRIEDKLLDIIPTEKSPTSNVSQSISIETFSDTNSDDTPPSV